MQNSLYYIVTFTDSMHVSIAREGRYYTVNTVLQREIPSIIRKKQIHPYLEVNNHILVFWENETSNLRSTIGPFHRGV